jgi:hypothetical protein
MTLLDSVSGTLTAHGIAHALIGAAALAARGIARSTFDIDLLTTDARVLERDLWISLSRDDLTIDVRRGDAEDPLGGVVRLEAPPERPVDIILGKYAWQTRAVEQAERVTGGPPIVLARDLILLKLYAGGTQDLWDIRELLRLPGAETLVTQVDDALSTQPATMRDIWEEARKR